MVLVLLVATGIGIWFYDTGTYQETALLTGHTRFDLVALHSARMGMDTRKWKCL